MAEKKDSRCWPGYEPVPGKPEHSKGSCKKKADSKSSASDKKAQGARQKQLDEWQNAHPGSSRSAAQHLHAPGATTKKTAAKKKATAKRKTTAKQANAKRTAAKRKTPA